MNKTHFILLHYVVDCWFSLLSLKVYVNKCHEKQQYYYILPFFRIRKEHKDVYRNGRYTFQSFY